MLPLLGTNGRLTLTSKKKSLGSLIWRYLPRLHRDRKSKADLADMDLIVYKHPKSQVSEAISHVYSSLMLSTSGQPPCAIMVTSPNPNEGKTMLAANLAQSYALNDRQVVLIDCDLRKPRLHQIFQLGSQPGLSNYLTGSAKSGRDSPSHYHPQLDHHNRRGPASQPRESLEL